ncbi:MAG: SurA N-terminal domain-containing protein [Hyphomicrobium sp.]|jgi:peptidyl-prolyl cis-trans isomerase D
MLDALRRGAQGWVAKLLFAILIVSFGVFWNVSGVFRGYGRGSIATVADRDISVGQFQRTYQGVLEQMKLEGGQKLTAEQGVMLGLDKQALEQLVAQAVVKVHADRLGLALSDEELVRGLKSDPNFLGPDGKFSRVGFDGLLRQMGLSEQGFFAIRREDELRRQLTDALRGAIVAPQPLVTDLSAWRDETRTLDHVVIDQTKITVPEPDEAKLRETYEANKTSFMTPEYRKVAALFLSADDLKKDIKPTDDELKAAYQESKASYDKPERRRIQQIAFKDKAQAEAARKELVEGSKNFLDVAKEAGAKESDVNLGMISKKQLIDPKIADAAFSMQRDKVSDVVEGRFTTVVLRVIEIEDGKESTFDEVKEQVREKLAAERARAHISERFDLIEEGRNAGKTLKEIGAEQKLSFVEAEAVDKDNKAPDGKTVIDNPATAALLKEAFKALPGATNDVVELATDSYAWFDVISTIEPKQKPFEEVKAAVKIFFIDTERARMLDELAEKLVDRLKGGGETFDKVAADAGGKAEVTETIKRSMSPPGLTAEAVKQAFTLSKGGAGSAKTSDRASRIVFQVREITPAAQLSKEQADKLAIEVRGELENDILIAYVTGLKKDLGVSVNQAELRRASGVATEQ